MPIVSGHCPIFGKHTILTVPISTKPRSHAKRAVLRPFVSRTLITRPLSGLGSRAHGVMVREAVVGVIVSVIANRVVVAGAVVASVVVGRAAEKFENKGKE